MASKRTEVDTISPFRSVKDAVAVYGERIGTGNAGSHKTSSSAKLDIIRSSIYSLPPPKPVFSANSSPPSLSSTFGLIHEKDDELTVLNTLKKLEAELCEAKRQLKLLKEMQSETKVAVATLSLKLQKRMPKLTDAEAVEAEESNLAIQKVQSDQWREERIRGSNHLPTLAQALSLGRMEDDHGGRGKINMGKKKKPIIPLIGDILPKKKGSSDIRDSYYSPSFYSALS